MRNALLDAYQPQNALAGLGPAPRPRRPEPKLGLVPVDYRTFAEVFRRAFKRVDWRMFDADPDKAWRTARRRTLEYLAADLEDGGVDAIVVVGGEQYRLPTYFWSNMLIDIWSAPNDVLTTLERLATTDTLRDDTLGAYDGHTVIFASEDAERLVTARTGSTPAEVASRNPNDRTPYRRAKALIAAAMRASPDEQPADWIKATAEARLRTEIQHLTPNAFNTAWKDAASDVPQAAVWLKPGRRSVKGKLKGPAD